MLNINIYFFSFLSLFCFISKLVNSLSASKIKSLGSSALTHSSIIGTSLVQSHEQDPQCHRYIWIYPMFSQNFWRYFCQPKVNNIRPTTLIKHNIQYITIVVLIFTLSKRAIIAKSILDVIWQCVISVCLAGNVSSACIFYIFFSKCTPYTGDAPTHMLHVRLDKILRIDLVTLNVFTAID